MDNLNTEKFTIGNIDPIMNYDGSGITPEQPMEQEDFNTDPTTFENDPVEQDVKDENVSADDLKADALDTSDLPEGESTEQPNYQTLLLIGIALVGFLFYKKK